MLAGCYAHAHARTRVHKRSLCTTMAATALMGVGGGSPTLLLRGCNTRERYNEIQLNRRLLPGDMWRGWHRANRETLSWLAAAESWEAGAANIKYGHITTRDCKELAVCVGRKS
eukprot:jgi/Chlat1/6360/Chrsp44S05824